MRWPLWVLLIWAGLLFQDCPAAVAQATCRDVNPSEPGNQPFDCDAFDSLPEGSIPGNNCSSLNPLPDSPPSLPACCVCETVVPEQNQVELAVKLSASTTKKSSKKASQQPAGGSGGADLTATVPAAIRLAAEVTNNALSAANDVSLVVELPQGVKYLDSPKPPQGISCSSLGGKVTCTIDRVDPGGLQLIELDTRVQAAGDWRLCATVSPSALQTDADPTTDQDCLTIAAVPPATCWDVDPSQPGNQTFDCGALNSPDNVTTCVLIEPVPSSTPSIFCCDCSTGPPEKDQVELAVKMTGAVTRRRGKKTTSSSSADMPVPQQQQRPDPSAGHVTAAAQSVLTLVVKVSNLQGVGDIATNVSVAVQLPRGVKYLGSPKLPPGITCALSGTRVSCIIDIVPYSKPQSIKLDTRVQAAGAVKMCAKVTPRPGQSDLDPSTDQDCMTAIVTGACCSRTSTAAGWLCTDRLPLQCPSSGGNVFKADAACLDASCPASVGGACCLGNSTCVEADTRNECLGQGGEFQEGATCKDSKCKDTCSDEWERCNPQDAQACCSGLSCESTNGAQAGTFVCKAYPNNACQNGQGGPCGGGSGYTCCKGLTCSWSSDNNPAGASGTCQPVSGCARPGKSCHSDAETCRGCRCMRGVSRLVTYRMCHRRCASYACYLDRQRSCACLYAAAASL